MQNHNLDPTLECWNIDLNQDWRNKKKKKKTQKKKAKLDPGVNSKEIKNLSTK